MAKGDIVEGQIGQVGEFDVEFKGGKLVAKLSAGMHGISGGAFLEMDADKVIDAIAKAIPGKVDDAILGVVKIGLKEVSG